MPRDDFGGEIDRRCGFGHSAAEHGFAFPLFGVAAGPIDGFEFPKLTLPRLGKSRDERRASFRDGAERYTVSVDGLLAKIHAGNV